MAGATEAPTGLRKTVEVRLDPDSAACAIQAQYSIDGGATWAALRKLTAEGRVKSGERIVLFNTGSGLKYPECLPREAPVLDPDDPKALDAIA